MKIIVSKKAGFCFGVERAINKVIEEAKVKEICTYGSLINNKHVVKHLESLKVRSIKNINEVNEKETVALRAHGVPPEIYAYLDDNNIEYFDCTCPFVKKIHKIVYDEYKKGNTIIIIGDEKHPEIIGINGFVENNGIVLDSLEKLIQYSIENTNNYSLVVQTTFDIQKFQEIISHINKNNLNIEIFNTICNATIERQVEAEEISKVVDKMLIIGGKNSSNTKKLYDISKKNCRNSYLLESISEIKLNIFEYGDKIGITAGASTPPCIIKEAINTMSELNNTDNNTEMSFEEMLEESFVTLHTGEIVKGIVLGVSDGEVFVNLGYKSDGIISREELSDDPSFKAAEEYNVGDDIEVYIVRVNDGEGNVQLSRKRIEAQKNMGEIESAFKNNEVVEGRIVEVVKGGLMALINSVKIFVPSSQISNRYVEDLKGFIGHEYKFSILEFEPQKRRIVAGRKELAQKEEDKKRAEIFKTIEIGKIYDGVVRRIVDFGAFVDLGGIDGLVHISELSWERVRRVSDILKEGEEIEVTVIDFDEGKGKISLTLKDPKADPWFDVEEKYPIGEIVEGKVARMVPFGAFVELEPGVDGLVHISHIANKHVVKPEDELSIGEIINVKITDMDKDNKRISLSKKEADEPTVEEPIEDASEEGSKTRLIYQTPDEDKEVEETEDEEVEETEDEEVEETEDKEVEETEDKEVEETEDEEVEETEDEEVEETEDEEVEETEDKEVEETEDKEVEETEDKEVEETEDKEVEETKDKEVEETEDKEVEETEDKEVEETEDEEVEETEDEDEETEDEEVNKNEENTEDEEVNKNEENTEDEEETEDEDDDEDDEEEEVNENEENTEE